MDVIAAGGAAQSRGALPGVAVIRGEPNAEGGSVQVGFHHLRGLGVVRQPDKPSVRKPGDCGHRNRRAEVLFGDFFFSVHVNPLGSAEKQESPILIFYQLPTGVTGFGHYFFKHSAPPLKR